MHEIDLDSDRLRIVGAQHIEHTDEGLVLRRLPVSARAQILDPALHLLVQMPSGVRFDFDTDSTSIEIDVGLTLIKLGDRPVVPAAFDLVVDGEVVASTTTADGTVIVIDATDGTISFEVGAPFATVRFDGLSAGSKRVEVWLPHAAAVVLRSVRIDDGATAQAPTGVWPVVAARRAGVELDSLAFAGQCQLDPFVARTIRDLPVDLISLKVGINLVNGDTMRERTFVPAVHGFLDTIREGHPADPILLVTPILCPAHEHHPGPTVGGDRIAIVDRPKSLGLGALTLVRIRELLTEVVAGRRALGDENLFLLDGRDLFGPDDLDDLPDGLHPNAAGYRRMGERFHRLAFEPGAPFA
jgi:lysophospholipase L1-like esterase